ncbi:MAG: hypothetical protein ACI9G9_001135 [Psychromonas sp.]|jgi:uncharacterized protein (TIGR00255 family)
MLHSMTGFGKASGSFQGKKVTIEIRALNSKSLDLNVRMPSLYRELESIMRKNIGKALERGKVDVNINIEDSVTTKSTSINKDLVKAYYEDLKATNDFIGEKSVDYLSLIMRMPDVLSSEKEEVSDEEKAWLLEILDEAIVKLNEFRQQEGAALQSEFADRISDLGNLLKETEKFENDRVLGIRQKLTKSLEDIQNGNFDTNRLEQELIFYVEKLDVSEEKQRLSNHLDYFNETMNLARTGRKLGFITQEIGREINTLGSKSSNAEMQKKVVEMKDNLEKIKEQVLNTL